MNATLVTLYILVCAAYLTVTVDYALRFVRRGQGLPAWRPAERAATLLLHILFLSVLGAAHGQLPMAAPAGFFSMTALGLILVHTVLEARFRSWETGMFFFGLALVLQLASWPAVFARPEPHELLRNPIFGLHVAAALLGYVGFLVSALCGVLYLALYQMLKTRRLGLFCERMPALDRLVGMNLHAALVGFICLTAALVLGIELSARLDVEALRDAKVIQSAAAWLLYGLLLAGRYLLGWRGRAQVVLSIVCFALMALSALLVQLYLPTFHQF
jgi:ABC-type uncharacterized transport system permease subunit